MLGNPATGRQYESRMGVMKSYVHTGGKNAKLNQSQEYSPILENARKLLDSRQESRNSFRKNKAQTRKPPPGSGSKPGSAVGSSRNPVKKQDDVFKVYQSARNVNNAVSRNSTDIY